MDSAKPYDICHIDTGRGATSPTEIQLIEEEPLSIRIQGNPYVVVMRTPGEEKAHVAGLCLAEGIVDRVEDIAAIAFCDGPDTNVVTVTLAPERGRLIDGLLDRREFISQSSCGLCGKAVVEELCQQIHPVSGSIALSADRVLACINDLPLHQPLRGKTFAAHAAAVFDDDCRVLSAAEDVGRHNALDKAVGRLFMRGRLSSAALLVLSSRISYELVQKAARARIPVIVAISRPTSLAVELAASLDITLASLSPGDGLLVYCHPHRLR